MLHNELLKQFAENQTNIQFVDINQIFEILINDTDNFNKEYQTSIDPNKTTESCWRGGYFAYEHTNESKHFYKSLLTSNPKPKVLQNFNNITSKKIDMGKIPLTPDITTAILTAETITLCKNPQEFVFWDGVHPTYQIHKALFKYIAKEYLGIRL